MIPAVDVSELDLELEAFLRNRRTDEYLFGIFRRNKLCGVLNLYYVPCCGDVYTLHIASCALCGAQAEINRKQEELRQAEHRARMLNARRR